MSSTLRSVRDALITALQADARLSGAHISFHGGDFSLADVKRYSKKAPAVVIGLLGYKIETEDGSVMATTHWGAVCMTVDGAGDKKRHSILDLADATTRALVWAFPGSATTFVSRPRNIRSQNEYTPPADAEGVALWSISWDQVIELVDVDSDLGDLSTVDVLYDLAPRPDGEDLGDVPEAEDTLLDLET